MRQIPQQGVLRQNNYGDIGGDIVESFNLDLIDNIGAIRATRMKEVTNSTTESELALPVWIGFYNDEYVLVTSSFLYRGGANPSDPFTKDTRGTELSEAVESLSDGEIFNNCLYVSASDSIWKLNGSTWSKPITTQLTAARPHLLKAFGQNSNARLYVTDEYYKVHSITTGDAISATGSYTFDPGLSNDWTITMLEAAENALFIGYLNTSTGKGLVYEWDGVTENIYNRRFELDAGPAAGVVLSNVPYIMDIRGRLLQSNGSQFVEIDRLFLKEDYNLINTNSGTNLRFIHPNGMTATDENTILILVDNEQEQQLGFEDTVPAGIYEWHPELGLYHKYSFSTSPVGGVTTPDYGQRRVAEGGAIYYKRPAVPTAAGNGTLLAGARVYTNSTTTRFGVFTNDTLDTTPKLGSFITSWFQSDAVSDTWQKAYGMYKDFLTAGNKIVVKYRTREVTPVVATCAWLNSTQFNTTTDVSDFQVGDEVTIIEGEGAGTPLTITAISSSSSTYSITVEENPTSADAAFTGLFRNYRKIGSMNKEQLEMLTISKDNVSPRCQFKVDMYFTGPQELHRLRIINKPHITE